MKSTLNQYLPLVMIFIIISLFWLFRGYPWYLYIILFVGLIIGALSLYADHLIYWLYTHPQLEESRLAQLTLAKRDYRSTFKLLLSTQNQHTDLIFHNIVFNLILLFVSIFALTSTDSVLGKSFLVGINFKLLLDQYHDWKKNPTHLQTWLFARLPQQFPLAYLKNWLILLFIINLIFIYLLSLSR